VPRRRRQSHGLERVLGAPALFATAYGNVGSSIYYALGLVAGIALGLTPLVFIISGLIFAATAATYAEGTVRYPEAGGSSSFARHAFNELVSFFAAWAQMLNYVITVAISVIFVPHYLSIFWGPLRTNPWDIIVGIALTWLLVGINIVGIKEASNLNIVLAVIDFATQLLLVLLGFFLIFHPHVLWRIPARHPGRDDRLHRDRDRLQPGRGGARPGSVDSPCDLVGRDRGFRHLLHAAVDRALGDAGRS
jgi:basic amino acid/polyamine antiporter, APA family